MSSTIVLSFTASIAINFTKLRDSRVRPPCEAPNAHVKPVNGTLQSPCPFTASITTNYTGLKDRTAVLPYKPPTTLVKPNLWGSTDVLLFRISIATNPTGLWDSTLLLPFTGYTNRSYTRLRDTALAMPYLASIETTQQIVGRTPYRRPSRRLLLQSCFYPPHPPATSPQQLFSAWDPSPPPSRPTPPQCASRVDTPDLSPPPSRLAPPQPQGYIGDRRGHC